MRGMDTHTRSTQVVECHVRQPGVDILVVVPPLERVGNNGNWNTEIIINLADTSSRGD